jgi:type IV pilus assembly protein PilW
VTINHASIPAGDANTDTLLLVYGSNSGSPEGDLVNVQPNATTYAVATPTAFAVGDGIVAAVNPRPTPCNLTMERAITVTSPSPPHVVVSTGVAGMANGTLFNLGQAPRVLAYAVRDGSLTVCDGMVNNCSNAASVADRTIWVPIGDNVVSLRAQYGRDTTAPAMDGAVDDYAQTTPADACGWARVSALRVVLVTRSGQLEKTDVTAAAPAWAGAASEPVDLSSTANWQRFRYKSFETTVPLRNMAWQGAQTGC